MQINNILNVLSRKRDKEILSREDIIFFVKSVKEGIVDDSQIAAFLMACFINGLDNEETLHLTQALANSGNVLSWGKAMSVDKHSTGGVGDKTTIALLPVLSAYGFLVPKMAGRRLSYTGGTIEKIELIPGYNTKLSISDFVKQVERIGIGLISQTEEIAPVEGTFYKIRNHTGTVESSQLILSSIASKKLAVGSNFIIFDIKSGSGSLFSSYTASLEFAKNICNVMKKFNKKVSYIVSDMNQPLGKCVGNRLELWEALSFLHTREPYSLDKLIFNIFSNSYKAYFGIAPEKEINKIYNKIFEEGRTVQKAIEWIKNQGGDPKYVENPDYLLNGLNKVEILSSESGYIQGMDVRRIGWIGHYLSDRVDGGIVFNILIGDKVEKGDVLANIYARDINKLENIDLASCIDIKESICKKRELILDSKIL
ncbi:pyrimidine-nucleoside phosphorylase [Thermodesulfobium acidiphilum]|uniref:thymidine phosphorylase n=1 Tax=Thermodesulfobium acidiphilum TaxID=1794699 RepID=A0A2R4W173_THEAF|nr:thymidine phosphorylase [Thermodesulfobium acidiphilum]AWB10567.1 pyrimidine-nucleoside phosphorylase [Thermodesulfobium acidiphilum]